jgi:hypothetical protein
MQTLKNTFIRTTHLQNNLHAIRYKVKKTEAFKGIDFCCSQPLIHEEQQQQQMQMPEAEGSAAGSQAVILGLLAAIALLLYRRMFLLE